jgi:hypothetical protein
MKRLILTTSDSGAGGLISAGIGDIVIPFGFRFVRGPLPPDAELAALLGPRSRPARPHWLDNFDGGPREEIRRDGPGLIELCERCETVELWIDPDPNGQLTLIWLLDFFRAHGDSAAKLMLVQADVMIGGLAADEIGRLRLPTVQIRKDHLVAASTAWRAYRQPTPRAWFDLVGADLSVLPRLRPSVFELLEELPMRATGLGATEMRLLELISDGHAHPCDLFPGHGKRNEWRVFGYWEVGSLLDGLARAAAPAVSGLDEGPFSQEMHEDRDRHRRYKDSKLSLTSLGKAILARADDFSRHNPIQRWWGGTELSNDRIWRWDPASQALIAP